MIRIIIKNLLHRISYYSSLHKTIINKKHHNKLWSIYYHRIHENSQGLYKFDSFFNQTTTVDTFLNNIKELNRHFTFISPNEINDTTSNPKMLITFDDGDKGIYKYLKNVISEFNIKPIVFIVSKTLEDNDLTWDNKLHYLFSRMNHEKLIGFINDKFKTNLKNLKEANHFFKNNFKTTANRDNTLQEIQNTFSIDIPNDIINNSYVTEKEILELIKIGVSIGSHTHTHAFLPALSTEEIYNELDTSKKKLEAITGNEVVDLSFPSGGFNEEIIDIAKKLGYHRFYNTIEKVNNPEEINSCLINRFQNSNLNNNHLLFNLACIKGFFKNG